MDNNWTKLADRVDASMDAKLRRQCGVSNNRVRIVRITGDSAPVITGELGGHFTRGGGRIAYPAAYSRKGFGNMVYRTDSRVITVGVSYRVQ